MSLLSLFGDVTTALGGAAQFGQTLNQFGTAFGIEELQFGGGGSTQGPRAPVTHMGPGSGMAPHTTVPVTPISNPIVAAPVGARPGVVQINQPATNGGMRLPPVVAPGAGVDIPAMTGLEFDVYGDAQGVPGDRERAFHALFKRGYVPVQSEPGQELIRQGAKPVVVQSKALGGARVWAVPFRAGRTRRRRKNLTRDRLATASWVQRKLAGYVKLAKKHASANQKLLSACAPRRSSSCGTKRTTRKRC